MHPHHVVLPVSAGLELLCAAFYQALIHVLPLRQDLEERIVPLQDVGVQQMSGREGPLAKGANISVQRVVVVLVVVQGIEHLAAAGHLAGKRGHPGLLRRVGHLHEHVLEVEVALHVPILEELVLSREAHRARNEAKGRGPSRGVPLYRQWLRRPGPRGEAGAQRGGQLHHPGPGRAQPVGHRPPAEPDVTSCALPPPWGAARGLWLRYCV